MNPGLKIEKIFCHIIVIACDMNFPPFTIGRDIPQTHTLVLNVWVDGDLVNIFKTSVERTLTHEVNRLRRLVVARQDRRFFNVFKRDTLKYVRDLALNYDANFLEKVDSEEQVYILTRAIKNFYYNYYSEKEYGAMVSRKAHVFINSYMERDEVKRQIQQLVNDAWLEDLIEENGIHVIQSIKYPREAPTGAAAQN